MGSSESSISNHNAILAVFQAHVKTGDIKKCKKIIKKVQNANLLNVIKESSEGYTMLIMSIINQKMAILTHLIACGADVNIADAKGRTPLLHSASIGNSLMCGMLLESGAKVDLAANDGTTPLIAALQSFDERIVELLVDAGGDVNHAMNNGMNPLHIIIQQGNERMVRYLLEKGAEVDTRTEDGMTPYLRAKEGNFDRIMTILLEAFCKKYSLPQKSKGTQKRSSVQETNYRLDLEECDETTPTKEDESENNNTNTCDDDLKSISDDKCCKICWEKEADTVLLWCGHVAICMYCTQFLKSCPICCQPIKKVQRVYLC